MKIIISEEQFKNFLDLVTINGVDVYPDLTNIEENKNIGRQLLQDEKKEYKTSEDLLRNGGFTDLALDLSAFGFTEESVKHLSPKHLTIKWKTDLENVLWEVRRSGIDKITWSQRVKLDEPVDVSFDGKKFYLEDGHHRYYAASVLKKILNVNLEIKANPILGLGHNDYDVFHHDFFK